MRGFVAVGIAIACVGAPGTASASQLLFENSCKFVVEAHSLFGSTQMDYSVAKGTVFTSNSDGEFCGVTTMSTPVGDAPDTRCYRVAGNALDADSHSSKVVSSDCRIQNAESFATPYRDADFAAWAGAGNATLKGQAFLKTVGGDVKTCAGETVFVLPANPYVDELLEKWKAGVAANADPRAIATIHKTICDAQGNFAFASLRPAQWTVMTQVTWGVPHIEQPGERPGPLTALVLGLPPPPTTDQQGGELLQTVDLQAGDNQVFLTDRDLR